MDTKKQILVTLKNIELQEEAINDLQQIKPALNTTTLNPIEDIKVISSHLESDLEKLKGLHRGFHHDMLSRMVKGGIQDDEMMSWWMNRY